jgi:thymidylate kinase
VYLDLPEEELLKRLAATGKTGDRYESRGSDFYERVRRGYEEYRMAADFVVSTMLPEDVVASTVGSWLLSRN